MKNNNKMGIKILKHGDFTLKYFKYCDIYFLFYKDRVREYKFNELFLTQLIDRVFEREPDRNKAAEFIIELYQWLDSQEEAFTKLLDMVYGEEI